MSLQIDLWVFAQHTCLQCLTSIPLQHWSKQNAFLTAQTCSAKQADSRLVSLQIDLWVFAQHTCLQCLTTNALQHWSKQNAFLTTQTCFAKQGDSRLVSLQIDPWVFASSYRLCSVPISSALQHWSRRSCTSSLPRVALQNRLTAGLCQCKETSGICSTYMCAVSDHQCTPALVKTKVFPHLPRAALQNRLTAGLCHCK